MPSKGIPVVMLECTPICPLLRCETGTTRRISWKRWRALSALECAQYGFFNPVLKGIRSAHEAFIKDTLRVNG